jgi:hypothetical protein
MRENFFHPFFYSQAWVMIFGLGLGLGDLKASPFLEADLVEFHSTQWSLDLDFTSKVIPVHVEAGGQLLRRAEINRDRLESDQNLVVSQTFAEIEAGQHLKSGEKILLHFPEANRPLIDIHKEPIEAILLEEVLPIAREQMPVELLQFRTRIPETGVELQLALLAAYPTRADSIRYRAAHIEAEGFLTDYTAEELKMIEEFPRRAEISGFAVLKTEERKNFGFYRVLGHLLKDQEVWTLSLSSVSVADQLVDPTEAFSKLAYEIFVSKEKKALDAREDYIRIATELLDRSKSIQASLQPDDQTQWRLQTKEPQIQIELTLDQKMERMISGWLVSAKILHWNNKERLKEDRQQSQVLALQVQSEKESHDDVSAMAVIYPPELPADTHVCAPTFTRLLFHGKMMGPSTVALYRLFSEDMSTQNLWTLESAKFSLQNNGPSHITSWDFDPTQPEKFQTQELHTGLKSFVNWMTGFTTEAYFW